MYILVYVNLQIFIESSLPLSFSSCSISSLLFLGTLKLFCPSEVEVLFVSTFDFLLSYMKYSTRTLSLRLKREMNSSMVPLYYLIIIIITDPLNLYIYMSKYSIHLIAKTKLFDNSQQLLTAQLIELLNKSFQTRWLLELFKISYQLCLLSLILSSVSTQIYLHIAIVLLSSAHLEQVRKQVQLPSLFWHNTLNRYILLLYFLFLFLWSLLRIFLIFLFILFVFF